MKVGSAVRLRVFEDTGYRGDWVVFGPRTRDAGIGNLHDAISSARVEPANRSQTCDDLKNGEIALYAHPQFRGDCVVLAGKGSYASADAMGIGNDTISSIRNNSKREIRGFRDTSFANLMFMGKSYSDDEKLAEDTWGVDRADDSISSLQMLE